jgi:filamentous hemagglutinin family protein
MRGIKAEVPLQQQMKFLTGRLCFSVVCLLTILPANAEVQARKGLPASAALALKDLLRVAPNGDAVAKQVRRTRFLAQITPDGTLPTVVEEQDNMEKITGGERVGNNLFHSFEEFSIPEGIEAIFENGLDIENIFTRITGESASTINGILKTQGSANFFLVNPNGIVFGENAQLDVGGSFIATTADSIQFEDGIEFAAKNAESKPILTVSVPIGLGFAGDNGAITVNGTGNQIASDSGFSPIETSYVDIGLSIQPEKTLALIGGNITFNGGIVTAEGGKVELGSVKSGSVSFEQIDNQLAFNYDNVESYQNITLLDQTLLDTSGTGKGAISLTGNNVSLSNGSFLLNQNRGNVDSGDISINAFESLNLSGTSPDGKISSSIRSESVSAGQASSINIFTKQLSVLDDAQIRTGTYSKAPGNNVTVDASDFVKIVNSTISASTFADGNGGNIKLATSQLQVKDSGTITSSTIGTGNGGEVTVNANLIEVVGGSSTARSNISASSFSTGNASNLNIDTEQLKVQDGGSVSSSSFAEGNAGSVVVKASGSVEVDGINQNSSVSNPESSIKTAVQAASPGSQQALGLPAVPTGNSGNLILDTPSLKISGQGNISVENQGTGNAGTVSVDAKDVDLDNNGSITAASASGQGGNINLNTSSLHLDDNSSITATAKNNGDGGNININTTNLIAKKNSEVTANAFNGRGGNINLNTQGLFLFDSPNNIFSASSELGIDGEVNINTTIDFSSFEPISPEFIVAEEALQGSCFARRNSRQDSFVYGGAGGLPVSPSSAIDEESSLSFQLPEVQPNSQTSRSSDLDSEDNSAAAETVIYSAPTAQKWQVGEPIIEPTNLIKTADGRLLWVRKQVDNASSLICQ